MSAPEWTNGMPANLNAAARDALEWLLLIRRLNDADRWRFGKPDSRRRLDGLIDALREQLRTAPTPPDGQ